MTHVFVTSIYKGLLCDLDHWQAKMAIYNAFLVYDVNIYKICGNET